jgi:hypothetical protein
MKLNEDKTYPEKWKLLIAGKEKNLNTAQQIWQETTEADMLRSGQSWDERVRLLKVLVQY